MDNVVLGLSVAIAVVLVLLLSCWKGKPKKQAPAKSVAVAPALSCNKKDEDIIDKAQYGTGVDNRQAANRYSNLNNLQGYDDYNSVAQYMSLEPEVYDSHNRYADDMNRSTGGASLMSVRDDPNDLVPWVARKPFYQDVYVQPGARQEHSEYPDQMREKTYYVIG